MKSSKIKWTEIKWKLECSAFIPFLSLCMHPIRHHKFIDWWQPAEPFCTWYKKNSIISYYAKRSTTYIPLQYVIICLLIFSSYNGQTSKQIISLALLHIALKTANIKAIMLMSFREDATVVISTLPVKHTQTHHCIQKKQLWIQNSK